MKVQKSVVELLI